LVFRRVDAGHEFRRPGIQLRGTLDPVRAGAVDISNTVLFLASDEARNVTGVALPVDAGALNR
jgi:NAD(P)-dependent dehydrogenase (short-subunit alcohol dehydrogenase family)